MKIDEPKTPYVTEEEFERLCKEDPDWQAEVERNFTLLSGKRSTARFEQPITAGSSKNPFCMQHVNCAADAYFFTASPDLVRKAKTQHAKVLHWLHKTYLIKRIVRPPSSMIVNHASSVIHHPSFIFFLLILSSSFLLLSSSFVQSHQQSSQTSTMMWPLLSR